MNSIRVAYLINQYPKVSHSFIRREILALERQGMNVQRIALRGWHGDLVDAEDFTERERTRYVLQKGLTGLLRSTLEIVMSTPSRFFKGLHLACKMSRRADRSLPYHLIYLAEACRVALWLKREGATHLHAHFGTNSAEVAMLASELSDVPYSLTIHGSEEFDKAEAIGLSEKLKRATFVAAVSSFCRSQLYRSVAYAHWAKMHIVHCGVDPDFYSIDATTASERPRFVCVGRLCEQKGQQILIEAAAQLVRKGIDFELVLAGDGEMRPEVEALIAKHELGSRVRITGWISGEQVKQELLAARALVMASFAEGLPVVIMEAMSVQRPVLTTWIAGIPELVIEGENGWLYPPGSVDELASAMERCLNTPADELARMGARARTRVLARHDIDHEAAKLIALFYQVADDDRWLLGAQR
ncbi:glycosyltransferase family 4 protein [Herminiimonas arsenitoxidans]|uniref:glycosyltransferase family 4 protein n=1 Tax=Herminiimonas arsenitoxidans TaxID=1809410 RepID=UPI0018D29732|nr:glycosyltransferase family 4 protein [Herminiimonas arsenitoxidans]